MELTNKKILFFGDSVTDTWKDFNKDYKFGAGYVSYVESMFKLGSNNNITFVNKGIGGNKTTDLLNRIDKDVLEEKPDIVFLLIGINDVWHPFDEGKKVDTIKPVENIKKIVDILKDNNIKVIVLTPFLFVINDMFKGLKKYFNKFMDNLYEYLIKEEIEYLDTFEALDIVGETLGYEAITLDSVHPSILGHGVIAEMIFEYLKK